MKDELKLYLSITAVMWGVYFVVWLGVMFVKWEYVMPFQWVLDIPTYDSGVRFGILFLWLCVEGIKVLKVKVP